MRESMSARCMRCHSRFALTIFSTFSLPIYIARNECGHAPALTCIHIRIVYVGCVCARARAFSRFTAKIATDEILKYTHSEGIQLLCISSFFCVVLPLPEFRS